MSRSVLAVKIFPVMLLASQLLVQNTFADYPSLPREVREKLGKTFGLDPSSPEIDRRLFDDIKIEIPGANTQAPKQNYTPPPPLEKIQVVSHLKFSQGKAFKPETPALEAKESADDSGFDYAAYEAARSKKLSAKVNNPPELPRCAKARTDTREYAGPASKEIALDIVVLDREPPLEADEVFGKKTKFLRYSTNKGDIASASIASAGVKCLPYRVRLVGNTRYTYWGENALRNYDRNASGVMSPYMKRHVGEYR